ncbi:MAG: heavy-metal-associated domain-containing protein [Myxococcales bacterium]|nr:heavy-metal-associated domain-containing protein [Myxococcales bacterium]
MEQNFRVDGMTCGGCAAAVTRAIQGVDARVTVDVDLDGKLVRVSGPAEVQLDAAAVRAAIEDAGFDVAGD